MSRPSREEAVMRSHRISAAHLVPWLVAAVLVSACASTGAESVGERSPEAVAAAAAEPGSSCETSIVIEAENSREGIAAEYRWLAEHYPGYQREEQSLIQCGEGDRMADLIEFRTTDGELRKVYFDITSFFGKW
jgi:hypothetical protein